MPTSLWRFLTSSYSHLFQTAAGGDELRENKLRQLMSLASASSVMQEEECLAALQDCDWDVPSALRQIKLDSLTR